jgi:hypothetical protein
MSGESNTNVKTRSPQGMERKTNFGNHMRDDLFWISDFLDETNLLLTYITVLYRHWCPTAQQTNIVLYIRIYNIN